MLKDEDDAIGDDVARIAANATEDVVKEEEDEDEALQMYTEKKEFPTREFFGVKMTRHIRNFRFVKCGELPNVFTIIPRADQVRGAWRLKFGCESIYKGALLADESGTGKTLIAIIVIMLQLQKRGDYTGPCLMVTGGNVVENWSKEFEKWIRPECMPKILVLPQTRVVVVIMTCNARRMLILG